MSLNNQIYETTETWLLHPYISIVQIDIQPDKGTK